MAVLWLGACIVALVWLGMGLLLWRLCCVAQRVCQPERDEQDEWD